MFDHFSILCMKGLNSDCWNILKLYWFHSTSPSFKVFADLLKSSRTPTIKSPTLKGKSSKEIAAVLQFAKKWSVSACGWKQKMYPKKAEKQSLQHKILRFLTFQKVLEALKS